MDSKNNNIQEDLRANPKTDLLEISMRILFTSIHLKLI